MSHYFIVLEGVDGTGKTSVARGLAKAIGAHYILTPMSPLDRIEVLTESGSLISLTRYINNLQNVQVRFCYYLWASMHASHIISQLLESHPVVCDRYISSTLAYHRALDNSLDSFDPNWLNILQPDYEFMLTVSDEKEWQRRLRIKPVHSRSDEYLEEDWKLLRHVEQQYRRLGIQEIDTCKLTVEEVVTEILRRISL